jgi:ABC-type antimicrobial peptide transport system permease subunit
LRAAPGISSAAYVFSPPYSNILSDGGFRRAGSADETEHDAENTHVSPGYFATLGIPLLAGRDFTEADFRNTNDATADVVIVSERLAREVFPEGGAVGSQLILSDPKGKVVEIVGVAGNVRRRPITKEPAPFIYSPSLGTWGTIAVRSSLPFAQTAAVIRGVARDLNASLPPYDVEPMGGGFDRVLSEQRLLARFSVLLASVAALLAAVGIYGMLACAVGERMREFGIRLALGARAPILLRQVLYSAIRVTAIGMAGGLAAAYVATRTLEARLYGLTHSDPSTLVVTCAGLVAIAIIASLGPAVRAARADPIQAIRSE